MSEEKLAEQSREVLTLIAAELQVRLASYLGSARTLYNLSLGPCQAIVSLENLILPPILYGRNMSVLTPNRIAPFSSLDSLSLVPRLL